MPEQPNSFQKENFGEKIEELVKKASSILEKIENINSTLPAPPSNSYSDITSAFKSFFQTYEDLPSRRTRQDIIRENFDLCVLKLDILEKYLRLIEDHPQFLQGELDNRTGACPDLNQRAEQEKIQTTQREKTQPGYKDRRSRADIYIQLVWDTLQNKKV